MIGVITLQLLCVLRSPLLFCLLAVAALAHGKGYSIVPPARLNCPSISAQTHSPHAAIHKAMHHLGVLQSPIHFRVLSSLSSPAFGARYDHFHWLDSAAHPPYSEISCLYLKYNVRHK